MTEIKVKVLTDNNEMWGDFNLALKLAKKYDVDELKITNVENTGQKDTLEDIIKFKEELVEIKANYRVGVGLDSNSKFYLSMAVWELEKIINKLTPVETIPGPSVTETNEVKDAPISTMTEEKPKVAAPAKKKATTTKKAKKDNSEE